MPLSREQTQARLDLLASGTLSHTPSQTYTVADRIEEQATAQAEQTFLLFGDTTITYAEFNTLANRVAHAIKDSAGLEAGDVVAVMIENRPEFIVAWAGLAKLAVTAALLNTNTRGAALSHAITETGARALIVGAECMDAAADALKENASLPVYLLNDPAQPSDETPTAAALPPGWTELGRLMEQASTQNPDPQLRRGLKAGDDLFHVFTSGTTGLPKAARLSHMRFLGVGDGMSAIAGYGPSDVIACILPLYHGAAGMVVVSCALSQGAAIMIRRRFSASRFWDDVRRYRVTGCQYIGEVCRYLVNRPPAADDRDHSLRVMMGAGLRPDIWEEFRVRFGIEHIFEGWSSTEANTSLINLDNTPGSCGRIPFKERHNGRLLRYDAETDSHPTNDQGFMIECEAGEIGEFIGMIPDLPDSGAGRFEGYTSQEATERKILHNVFAKGDAWYRSGDLFHHDEEDYFYFVDRIGDTFRWKSENVSTQEVAEALLGFDGIEFANVYGVEVPDTEGRAGMAALVLKDSASFDGRAFYDHALASLPDYAVPVFVRLSAQTDMTSTFKLKKVDLQREGYDPARVKDPLFVRDDEARAYLPIKSGKQ